ncbi:MAG: Permease of the drug/metabolite transporter (DMT) superfamily, partial [uncultured Chloroflexi bacterium]
AGVSGGGGGNLWVGVAVPCGEAGTGGGAAGGGGAGAGSNRERGAGNVFYRAVPRPAAGAGAPPARGDDGLAAGSGGRRRVVHRHVAAGDDGAAGAAGICGWPAEQSVAALDRDLRDAGRSCGARRAADGRVPRRGGGCSAGAFGWERRGRRRSRRERDGVSRSCRRRAAGAVWKHAHWVLTGAYAPADAGARSTGADGDWRRVGSLAAAGADTAWDRRLARRVSGSVGRDAVAAGVVRSDVHRAELWVVVVRAGAPAGISGGAAAVLDCSRRRGAGGGAVRRAGRSANGVRHAGDPRGHRTGTTGRGGFV